jgi:hypothetical protein
MATDRTVYWDTRKPDRREVEVVIRDFLGSVGDVRWNDDCSRWLVTLPGTPSWPLARITPIGHRPGLAPEERWFEVWEDDERTYLSVITRQQDEFTAALADRLAEVFARYWQGRRGAK